MLTDSEILRRAQRRAAFRVVPTADWRALLRRRTNVLVSGPAEALTAFVRIARSEMREPIRSAASALPQALDGARTLILTDVGALDGHNQQRLVRWLDELENREMQIISLTSVPLFSLVERNAFDARLYYRLNTIFIEIEAA
jgi:transcriptional regulator of acetoin/glycerol metabolism